MYLLACCLFTFQLPSIQSRAACKTMENKIILLFVLITVGNAAKRDNFLYGKSVEYAELNPCRNRQGAHFAKNTRGCSWYFVCDDNNNLVSENRCDDGLHFNYNQQKCDYRSNVTCDLDDRYRNMTCPEESRGINVIAHPYTCLKYTGKC